jgi:hypothetical protein
MRRSIWLMGAVLAFAVGSAVAAPMPAAGETAQQEKMTTCNADAKTKGLTGDPRKAFMKECLSKHPTAAAAAPPAAPAATTH